MFRDITYSAKHETLFIYEVSLFALNVKGFQRHKQDSIFVIGFPDGTQILFSVICSRQYLRFQLCVGLFGLIGNIVSIVIFSRKDMKTHFNRLLVGLAVFDSIFISMMLIDYAFIRGEEDFYLYFVSYTSKESFLFERKTFGDQFSLHLRNH